MPQGRRKDRDAAHSTTRDAVLENEATWLEKAMEESKSEGKKYYPPLSQRAFDELKRNRENLRPEFWSDEDEARVQDQWKLDLDAKPFRKPHPTENGVWKTCARFLRCLPTELIGMRYGLECDAVGANAQNWTQGFCQALGVVIAHPIFANNPAKIALAIKFSVCSWQRLKWDIPELPDLFLGVVRRVAENNGEMVGAELVRDSIKQWRRSWPEEGELPPWAHLLRAIAANSKRPISAAEWPHRVATHHLSAIVTSVDEITHAKLVLFHSASLYERRTKDLRANVDRPVVEEDTVERLHADGIVHNRRLKVLSERHPDVADIYKHVSVPEAPRPLPKKDYEDIYVNPPGAETSSDPEEQPRAGGPARPRRTARTAQPNTGEKRKRGRPKKVKQAQEPPSEDDSDADEEFDDEEELDDGADDADQVPHPDKRRRGRPKKSEATAAKKDEAAAAQKRGRPPNDAAPAVPFSDDGAAPHFSDDGAAPHFSDDGADADVQGAEADAPRPGGTVTAARPNVSDAGALDTELGDGPGAARAQRERVGYEELVRSPSVPDSTTGGNPVGLALHRTPFGLLGDGAATYGGPLSRRGFFGRRRQSAGGNSPIGHDDFFSSDGDADLAIDSFVNASGQQPEQYQAPLGDSPARARPTTSQSQDLGERTPSRQVLSEGAPGEEDVVLPTIEGVDNAPRSRAASLGLSLIDYDSPGPSEGLSSGSDSDGLAAVDAGEAQHIQEQVVSLPAATPQGNAHLVYDTRRAGPAAQQPQDDRGWDWAET